MRALVRRIRPLGLLWLTAMWCILYGEITVGNVAAGLAIGLIIQLVFPLPTLPLDAVTVNWRQLMKLIWMFISGLVSGAVSVSRLAIRPSAPPKSAILTAPMRVNSDLAMVVGVSLYNLQPGGTVLEIDLTNHQWTVHLLDASSHVKIDKGLADIARLEHLLRTAFEDNDLDLTGQRAELAVNSSGHERTR